MKLATFSTRHLCLSLVAGALSCSAQSDETWSEDGYATQEVMIDEGYAVVDDPAFSDDDSGESLGHDLGKLEQRWVSGQYFGIEPGGGRVACGNATTSHDCIFPEFKQVRYRFDGLSTTCLKDRNGTILPPGDIPIMQDILSGMTGAAIIAARTGTGFTYTQDNANPTLIIDCTPTVVAGALAETDLIVNCASGTQHTQIDDAPGIVRKLLQCSRVKIRLNPQLLVSTAKNCGVVGNLNTPALRQAFGRNVALHEIGHSMGWGHFTSGVMKQGLSCSPTPGVTPPQLILNNFSAAMKAVTSAYNGSVNGGVSLPPSGISPADLLPN